MPLTSVVLRAGTVLCLSALFLSAFARAGEIPGLPVANLPDVPRRAQVTLGNDVLAGGGTLLDDYRTQQLILDVRIAERWSAAIDHSVLTYEEPGFQQEWGRLDQLSAAFGYDFLRRIGEHRSLTLTAGAGLRSVNDFGGAEIQNGFHRLVDDRIVRLPYVATRRTDVTAWLRAESHAPMPWTGLRELFGPDWRLGYWLHGTGLATSDGQWDSTLVGNITLARSWFNAWFGVRGDWRRGYGRDSVQSATANNEETIYLVLGVRLGPLLLETQQSGEADKGYGRVSLVADIRPGSRRSTAGREFSLAGGVSAPKVYAVLQGRTEFCRWFACTDQRRWRLVGEARFGQPGIGNATDRYVQTLQLGGGLEAEQALAFLPAWLSTYGWAGGGWRREEVRGDELLRGQSSEAVDRLVAIAEVGLRATTLASNERWALRLQMGLSGWLPLGSKAVAFAGGTETLQRPGLGVLFSGLIEFRP